MSLSAQLQTLLQPDTRVEPPAKRFSVGLASTRDHVIAAQRLRYQVFIEEMGARLNIAEHGIEADEFDPYCDHLIVRDHEIDTVVGCYRILTDTQAQRAGRFYSQSEFDITRILALPGRIMEVGRTCVHPEYRGGAVIALLWNGIARYLLANRFDYLIGCASVPLRSGTNEIWLMYRRLARTSLAPENCRVHPRVPLPKINLTRVTQEPHVPPLINAYLRAGARVCGEPGWDPHFNVADLFVLLRADQVNARYARHFLDRAG
ncbi:MAG: GNAT family N-acetyltransferase [Gammaproteobacteria bacterium]|nr:GNAT family N-acetyltransferase [Gammaproteobacteria bacterium]